MRQPFLCIAAFAGTLLAATGAAPQQPVATAPASTVAVTESTYCFSYFRGLRPERQPPSYLVLKLNLEVSYHNGGGRPLIVPLAHERKVYMSLARGTMKPLKTPGSFNIFEPSVSVMKRLPADVSPDNPVNPANDVFGIFASHVGTALPDVEEVTIPVYVKSQLKKYPDLRGHKVYLRLKLDHQGIDPALWAVLSDRWARFGVPWTGSTLSNTLVIDVPADANGKPCVDKPDKPQIDPRKDDAYRR